MSRRPTNSVRALKATRPLQHIWHFLRNCKKSARISSYLENNNGPMRKMSAAWDWSDSCIPHSSFHKPCVIFPAAQCWIYHRCHKWMIIAQTAASAQPPIKKVLEGDANTARWLILCNRFYVLLLHSICNSVRMTCLIKRLLVLSYLVVRWRQEFYPAADPLPGSAGRPRFNQLEMVTTFTYRPTLVK